ncbi:hypothetical protein OPT61_g3123 [Boeremia exigua]|uniref:Uncharacterized protein n=1 Tax=Boeremia exigua TaxID=749465 RepID=A0ACC2IJ30_9PLEO|nr:hypothetical protein OPT61_g3123 [Boeremia exigua]
MSTGRAKQPCERAIAHTENWIYENCPGCYRQSHSAAVSFEELPLTMRGRKSKETCRGLFYIRAGSYGFKQHESEAHFCGYEHMSNSTTGCTNDKCKSRNAPLSIEEVVFLLRIGKHRFVKTSVQNFTSRYGKRGERGSPNVGALRLEQVVEAIPNWREPSISWSVQEETPVDWPIYDTLVAMDQQFRAHGVKELFQARLEEQQMERNEAAVAVTPEDEKPAIPDLEAQIQDKMCAEQEKNKKHKKAEKPQTMEHKKNADQPLTADLLGVEEFKDWFQASLRYTSQGRFVVKFKDVTRFPKKKIKSWDNVTLMEFMKNTLNILHSPGGEEDRKDLDYPGRGHEEHYFEALDEGLGHSPAVSQQAAESKNYDTAAYSKNNSKDSGDLTANTTRSLARITTADQRKNFADHQFSEEAVGQVCS